MDAVRDRRQVLHQEALGFTPPSEDHDPVVGILPLPAPIQSDQLEQPLVFGELNDADGIQ